MNDAPHWLTTLGAERWQQVQQAPLAALYLVASAAPSRGGAAASEIQAAADALQTLVQQASPGSLLAHAFAAGFDQASYATMVEAEPGPEVSLRTISNALSSVQAHSPGEASLFRSLILGVAQRSAEAAKEGGVLGFGGVRVSEEEQAALDAIRAMLH
ncbi:MAG: hypothetical protein AB4911_07660 [Oscillochloridaceae bacterium umkhey_bin13]